MENQRVVDDLPLFGGTEKRRPEHAPYQVSSETSREAAERISPHITKMQGVVLNAIASRGEQGATRKELEEITGYLTQTLCGRLNDLETKMSPPRIRKLYELKDGRAVVVKRDGCAVYVRAGA